MYRRVTVASIMILLLSLAFASVTFAQEATGNQGGTPDSAFTSLPEGGRNLGAGEQHWYAFQYAGDNSQIQTRLTGSNNQFSVWTQQDVQNAAGNFGGSANPTGRSTANSNLDDDQYWSGSFNAPGTYYVMVENSSGGQGGSYALQITGSGVSWRGPSGSTATTTTGSTATTTSGSTAAQGGTAPTTLPQTGGEMTSVLPLIVGGLGAMSVAAGAMLRRRK